MAAEISASAAPPVVPNDLRDPEPAPALEPTAADRAAARREGEPEWLAGFRAAGLAAWRELPWPLRSQHLWRYTDPRSFDPAVDPFAGESAPAVAGTPAAAGASAESAASGPAIRALVPEAARRAGVVVLDLAAAARERPEEVERALGTAIGPAFGKLEALNAAAFGAGLFVFVPRGIELREPIRLVTSAGRGRFAAARLLVVAGANASATVIEELERGPSGGTAQFYGVAEYVVEDGARLQSVTIQSFDRTVQAHLTQRARVGRGGVFAPVLASFGGALVKTDTGARLEGEGSESEMTGFLAASGRQRFDHHTLHHHLGRHTRSNLDYKTVLRGKARSIYTGLIRIEADAAFSQAYQENRNLLLSADSRADSIPELEIMTEEVSCTHGATAGPLDPEQLFYLMSRGVPPAEAVRMIVEGHFEPTLSRLPEEMQDRLRATLGERLK